MAVKAVRVKRSDGAQGYEWKWVEVSEKEIAKKEADEGVLKQKGMRATPKQPEEPTEEEKPKGQQKKEK